MIYSFTQLYSYHVFGIPLPEGSPMGYCRECGGYINTPAKRDYGVSWQDEGLLVYQESPYVCAACVEAKKGSTVRSVIVPPSGTVLLVTFKGTHPSPELLRWCYEEDTVRRKKNKNETQDDEIDEKEKVRAKVYKDLLPLEQVIREYRSYPIPFGIVVGTGGKAQKHFLRLVPLNYDVKDVLVLYVVPSYQAVYIRPMLLSTALDNAQEFEPLDDKKIPQIVQFYKQVENLQIHYGLTSAERRMLEIMLRFKNGQQGNQ